MKHFSDFSQLSNPLKVIFILLAILMIFSAGVFVGYHKARFAENWDRGYAQNWNDPKSMLAPFMHNNDDMNAHGAIGVISSVGDNQLMVKNPFEAEKIVIFGSNTTIHVMHGDGTTTDLVPGQHILTIGSPDDQGRIIATFIRIIPTPPTGTSTGTSAPMQR
jgi:hypothetical protein